MAFISKHKWKIFIVLVVLYVIGMIGAGMHLYSFILKNVADGSPMIEVIKFEMIALGGLGVISPAYLSICQAIVAESHREIENTMMLIQRWDDPSLLDARSFTRKIKDAHDAMSPDDIRAEIKGNEKLRSSVILVFNYLDYVRVSLETNRVNKEIIKQSLKETALDIIARFDPWLKNQPKAMCDDVATLKKLLD